MVGSVDRHAHPDQPDLPGRPDAAREQPKPPRETEAQLAERLGLSTLTRASAYEALREGLADEERETSAESPEPLTESPDASALSTDKPERDPEAPRTYWTEVPTFLANWQRHTDKWLGKWYMESAPKDGGRHFDVSPERHARAADAVAKLPRAEPPISDTIKQVERENSYRGCLVGFEYRTKGNDRLMQKALESLEAQPGANPEEAVSRIPDAIRYTFCFKRDDYTDGFRDIKNQLESSDYEMYYSKNTWSDAEYRGINTRWAAPGGQRFEVQFHTLESFHAKHEVTHQAYERIRDPGITRTERDDLHAFQREVSSWIPVPRGATEIPDCRKEGF